MILETLIEQSERVLVCRKLEAVNVYDGKKECTLCESRLHGQAELSSLMNARDGPKAVQQSYYTGLCYSTLELHRRVLLWLLTR